MKTLNDYTDTLTSKLFADNGAFFAFGNKQFDEQKKEGVKHSKEHVQKRINALKGKKYKKKE